MATTNVHPIEQYNAKDCLSLSLIVLLEIKFTSKWNYPDAKTIWVKFKVLSHSVKRKKLNQHLTKHMIFPFEY